MEFYRGMNIQIVKFLCNNLRSGFDIDEAFEEIKSKIQSEGKCKKESFNDGEYSVIDPNDMLIMCILEMEINSEVFKVIIHKQTYEKTKNEVLNTIELEISSVSNNKEALYEIKVKSKDILKNYFKEIFILKDSQNEVLCSQLYLIIHIVENRFRELINKYMLRKYGVKWFKNNIKEEYQKKSNQYVGWYNRKYNDFSDIQSELFNLQTDDLIEMLEKSYINQLDKQTVDSITDLKNKLGKDASLVFNDFVVNLQNIWDTEIKKLLPEDFKSTWAEFSNMRNMIAHNKPICSSLEKDIRKMIEKLSAILDKFEFKIESRITSLEKKEAEWMEEAMYDEIFREEAGIDPLPERETVLEEIQEHEDIQELFTLIEDFISDYKGAIEDLECCINELGDLNVFEDYSIEEFKDAAIELYNFLGECKFSNDECKIKIISIAMSEPIREILMEDLALKISSLKFNTDGIVQSDCFDENCAIFKYTNIFGETIELKSEGDIYPESGSSNDITLKMTFDGVSAATGGINRSYGDYEINDEQGYAMPITEDDLDINVQEIVEELNLHFQKTISRIRKYEKYISDIVYE